jgi:hypothetical protein
VRLVASLLLLAAQAGQPAGTTPVGLPLTGAEAERFLATARVVDLQKYESLGITHPRRATLNDGERTARAVFKDIDVTHVEEQTSTGKRMLNLRDSYKHEIAAYQLDQLLGLGLVPPCVERRISRRVGALCLWVEDTMTEYERAVIKKVAPPAVAAYNDQLYDVRLFSQLIWDTDFANASNILVDANWKVYKVDSTRAFRESPTLRNEDSLTRFRRQTLAALESLTRESLDAALVPWLDKRQLEGLWKRRCRVLELARERVASRGEAAVLYDDP